MDFRDYVGVFDRPIAESADRYEGRSWPLPDLRYASTQTLEGLEGIVLGGKRASLGMPSFQKILNAGQVKAIQAYIVSRARESAQGGTGSGQK